MRGIRSLSGDVLSSVERDETFVGRHDERATLGRALDDAWAGVQRIALIRGPAGIGKSALLRRVVADATGAVVLRGTGDESETGLPFGVIDQLVGRLDDVPSQLVSLLNEGRERESIAIGAALLQLMDRLQDSGPVVIVVDDAHWADPPSLHALSFFLRRLSADRVLALFSARSDESLAPQFMKLFDGGPGVDISLRGLDGSELRELAIALGAGSLSLRNAARLGRHTGGNPLLVRAFLQEVGTDALRTLDDAATPVPRSYATFVLGRVAGCSPAARDFVAAACVLGSRWTIGAVAALAEIEDPWPALDEAVSAGLIEIADTPTGRIGNFAHPLVRSAIYQELGLARRAELHRAAATLSDEPRESLRHRVVAEHGSNSALALEAGEFAMRDAAAGAWSSAITEFLWSSRLAKSRLGREAQLLAAVIGHVTIGDMPAARDLLASLPSLEETPLLHFARGYLAWGDGDLTAAERELRRAWDLDDRRIWVATGARAADVLAMLYLYVGRSSDAIEWAQRALESGAATLPGSNVYTGLLLAYGSSGRLREGFSIAAGLDLASDRPEIIDGIVGRGSIRLWADDPAGARGDLLPIAERCLREGPLERGMFAAVHLADAEYRLGLWDDAILHSERALWSTEQALHGWFAAEAHAAAAFPLSARGQWDAAEAQVHGAVAAAKAVGYGHGTLWAVVARARLAAARRDPERVVRILTPLLGFTAADGVDHPGILAWRELLGVSLVALGHGEEALTHATVLEEQAEQMELQTPRASAERIRGLAAAARGGYDEAQARLEEALDHLGPLPLPFDRALMEADLGAALRRAGKRKAASERLASARVTLVRLGADPYLSRVDQELAKSGLTPLRDRAASAARLTPSEQAVAHLVAQGLSNKAVAERLVVSVKTVEHHLGRIYPKLGISSRSQLAAGMRVEDEGSSARTIG